MARHTEQVAAGKGVLAETGLVRAARFIQPGVPSPDARELHRRGGRRAEEFYRERWRHDKIVRSTHGVNCTGSCSWQVYVKDGIITWETQAVDYPSVGPGSPEYEPRGCPRGASFSWYTYSPARVRYPYVRGVLLEAFRAAKAANGGDPVAAWAELTGDPVRSAAYKSARGQGGFVRAGWAEALELIAAAHVHTVAAYGPDRTAGFTVIPAMSMASYAAGSRFYSLLGGTILSFYDWYADLPPASPQTFGDQTDVPESADWWNASYLIVWGTNLPITRTPDAHFMTEARYRGQKVVVVSPDYSDHTKFADDWLAAGRLGVCRDVMAVPLGHDTPDECAQPGGRARDWAAGECEPVPGRTMPRLVVVERDYPRLAEKWRALGPLVDAAGATTKGVRLPVGDEVGWLAQRNGTIREGIAAGRPRIDRANLFCEAILAMSGTTNGRLAVAGFEGLEERTGVELADLAHERAGDRITFADTVTQPRSVIASPEWSGAESENRRYSPFTVNVDRLKPWHTLTGRQHFLVDHDWMAELGEMLPTYRPPLDIGAIFGDPRDDGVDRPQLVARYLTPHSKWSIHSEYQDNLHMLNLFRGGPVIWVNDLDASRIGVADNDWIEAYNRNGVTVARAAVTHRIPPGTVMMYHSVDRHLQMPVSERSGLHGGTDNSLTRIVMKPTHMIGGYAQLSAGFNYYGPTGSQRDELAVLRRRSQEVEF